MELEALADQLKQLKELQRMQEELEDEIEAIKNVVKGELTARNVQELTAGEYKVRWVEVKSSRLDARALRAALPEIAERYTVVSSSKRFTVS